MNPEAPAPACPKCGLSRAANAESCARCGLVFARWQPEAADRTPGLDDLGQRLWDDLQGAWSDEARHDMFVKHCSQAGCLPAAGRLYRERLDSAPADAAAARMQKRIVAMATAALAPTASRPPPVTRTRWFWAVILMALVVGMAGAFLMGLRR